jgi:sugar phosphate isomerase/epimerase
MNYDRRKFLQYSGVLAAGMAIGCDTASKMSSTGSTYAKDFGIQIWSVRDAMATNPDATLKSLASFGYKKIETFGGEKGLFWGKGNKGFKKYINDLGMTMHSAHTDVYKDFDKTVDDLAEIGVEYVVYAWEGPNKTIDDYKKMADYFNKIGESSIKKGVKLAFHNHDYTFNSIEGQYGQDILMQGTDSGLVDFEMDMYWVVTAGQDPIEWYKKYPDRFKLCHIKDREKGISDSEKFASCVLGQGMIDYKSILPIAQKFGMKHFYVEQEKYSAGSSVECAKMDAIFMKTL